MSEKEGMQRELDFLREAMERIESCINTGYENDDGDWVIPEEQATLIKHFLAEDV